MEPSVQTALNWIDVLKVGLASGVVAAIVGAFFQGLKELLIKKMQTRQEAEIDAIYLITKLEALAVQCANRYWTYGERVSDYNSVGERGSAPSCLKPDVVIDDARLSKVKRNIAARIAWLENEIALGSDIISSRWRNYLDSGDANDQYAELVGYYGRQSLHIARELREEYRLDYPGPGWGMDRIEEQLEDCFKTAKKSMEDDS